MSVKDHVWKKDEIVIDKRIAKRERQIAEMVERTHAFLPENVSMDNRRALARVLCREANALHYLEAHDYSSAISLLVSQSSEAGEFDTSLPRAVFILRECLEPVAGI